MSKLPVALAFVLLLGMVATNVTAQEPEEEEDAPAAPPSEEMNVLFAHGTGDDEFLGFMNTLEEDGDDTAMGTGQFVNNAKTWTFHLEPNLTQPLLLDPEKTIDVFVYLGSSSGAGRLTVTTQISSGEDVLAKGAAKTINVAANNQLLTWNLDVLNETIHEETNLTWVVKATGIATASFLSTGGDRKSNITLPIIGSAVQEEIPLNYADVSTVNVNETLEFENETDARQQYNWSLEDEDGVEGELMVEGTGNVSLTALDGNGTEVLNVNVTSGGDGGENSTNGTSNSTTVPLEAPDGLPGNWIINLTVSNFTGTIRLALGPVVENATLPTSSPASTNATRRPSASPTNETAGPASASPEGRGVPSIGLLVAAATMLGAAFAIRRRQA